MDEFFEVLSSRFRLFVHHKVRNRADAEEIVQDTLMTIHAEYNKITIRTSFSAWACKVLDNRILDYLRRKQREAQRFGANDDPGSGEFSVRETADPGLKRKLRDCLHKLCRRNRRYARILNLRFQGYKTADICGRMGIRPATLYSALSKARSMLDNCLDTGDLR